MHKPACTFLPDIIHPFTHFFIRYGTINKVFRPFYHIYTNKIASNFSTLPSRKAKKERSPEGLRPVKQFTTK